MSDESTAGIRLNKHISDTGICSRREADEFIEQRRVTVNGQVADNGVQVFPGDEVMVDGKRLRAKPQAVYLVYNKPVGITCTTDQSVPGNIIDAVRYRQRIFPIGRLDKPSEGLILLTNDGDIVNRILRAGNAHEKEYVVTVNRPFDEAFLKRMSGGLPILGTRTLPCKIRRINATTFNIILTQGLNRQIRRMTEFLGYNVTRLIRVRLMNIRLTGLKAGQWRELTRAEMDVINEMVADSSKTAEKSPRPRKTNRPKPAAAQSNKDVKPGNAAGNKKSTGSKSTKPDAGTRHTPPKANAPRSGSRNGGKQQPARPAGRSGGKAPSAGRSGGGAKKPRR
ncbi:23S rRNA pseudouridine(2604) synthase RluF [Oceanospirillaceae bacterium ASx5O]|nr:23S rRNA pseudouridine(2604) synthase RluF [Oceanospirillaceae bacterium ASx5O]